MDSDIHIKDNLKDINITTSSSLADNSQSQQQLPFDQGASDSPVTPHNASYDDDVRELTEYWYLHKKARCYGSHHQYRLQNFKGCVGDLVSDYNLNRQQAIEVLKACIQLHADTPDTPNWYLKHHQGLEYLNMAMAQVTDNPAIAALPFIRTLNSNSIAIFALTFSLCWTQGNRWFWRIFFTVLPSGNLNWFSKLVRSRFSTWLKCFLINNSTEG